jgi:hypothetical protein
VPPPPIQRAGTDASGPKGTLTPNQQGQFDENTLEGKPNNAGKDTNLGTSSPLVEQATRLLDGFPQWFTDASNGVLANPRACFVSPIACGANILASAIKDGGGRATNSNSGPGLSTTPSPALLDSPYSPSSVESRVNPPYQTNPAHDTSSPLYNPNKTPEPVDAQSAYDTGAVRGGLGTWYSRGQDGYYRYFSDNAGTVHFSGTVPAAQVPNSVLKQLGK